MEHPHRGTLYRFCCAGDIRSRATRETGRKTGRRARSSRGSRTSPGPGTSRGGRTSRGARPTRVCATRRRATGCLAHRRAARVGAARGAPAACPSVRRPARFGAGAAREGAANCGSCAAAANHGPQRRQPRWSKTRPTEPTQPAQQSGAPAWPGQCSNGGRCCGRCGSSTVRSRRTQRGPATKCDGAQSTEPHRSIGRSSGQQRPSLLGRCAA